jgi:hypothetical protein
MTILEIFENQQENTSDSPLGLPIIYIDKGDKLPKIRGRPQPQRTKGITMLPEWLTPGAFLIGLVLMAGVCWLADKLGWWE